MIITAEKGLRDFEFWSGGQDNAKYLTWDELDKIEEAIVESFPDGIDETRLNDLFWFDFGWVCETLGLSEEAVFDREVSE